MTDLVAYRSSVVTPDTAEALRQLELEVAKYKGFKINYWGVSRQGLGWENVTAYPGPTGYSAPHMSMRPTGREVYLRLDVPDVGAQEALEMLWGFVVPLGFMPFNRYPVMGKNSEVFHYFGDWKLIMDMLHGEGRGEKAWPSVVAAAQCEVGTWEGDRQVERSLQMHLFRLGVNCGPVDGRIGRRTLGALRALGLGGLTTLEALDRLKKMKPPPKTPKTLKKEKKGWEHGFLTIPDLPVEGFSTGEVELIRTKMGFALSARGAGKAIFVFREEG